MSDTTIPFGKIHPVQIPVSLLRAHEVGKVVFFVGAGVSMPAGLPSFRGLVWDLYEDLLGEKLSEELIGTSTEVQIVDFKNGHYDRVLDFLDRNALGGRGSSAGDIIRDRTVELLESYTVDALSKTCHKSLVQLASKPDGERTRLVTTNFDRLFELAVDELVIENPSYACTHLGPAGFEHKRDWEGIVYLHGRITISENSATSQSRTEHTNLVLAGADFGRAYIRDGWAARFMERILAGYTVVFVGYGLNDPPLRYMLSALQEEASQSGSLRGRLYTFEGYCSDGVNDEQNKIDRTRYWEEVGVQPILYPYLINCEDCKSEEGKKAKQDHSALNDALADWALLYTNRVEEGKIRLDAILQDSPNHQNPEQFSQVLTACYLLGDQGGKVAEHLKNNGEKVDFAWLPYFDGHLAVTKAEQEVLSNINNGEQEKKWESELLDTKLKQQIGELIDVAHQVKSGRDPTSSQWNIVQWACTRLDSPEIFVHIATYWQPLYRPLRWRIEQAVTGKGESSLSPKLQVCYELLLEGRFEKSVSSNDGLYLVDNPNDTYAEHQIEWVLLDMQIRYNASMSDAFSNKGPYLSIRKIDNDTGRYENKAAVLHKWAQNPISFLRKITRTLLQNNGVEQRLRKVGLAYPGASRQLDSISQLDESYDYGSLKSVVSVKVVVDNYLLEGKELNVLWQIAQGWLVENYHALQALGLYVLSQFLNLEKVGHREAIEYLNRDAGSGLPYLFQPYFVREVEELLETFAKTCSDEAATESLLDAIRDADLQAPEEDVYWPFESAEDILSVKAIRLKVLKAHGLKLNSQSEQIIKKSEAQNERVRNYDAMSKPRRNFGPYLNPVSPDNIVFENAEVEDWPVLLEQRGLETNDDWRGAIRALGPGDNTGLAALLLVSNPERISGERWSSIDWNTYQQHLKPELLVRIASTIAKLPVIRVEEMGATATLLLQQILIAAYSGDSAETIGLDGLQIADALSIIRESDSLRDHAYLISNVKWRYHKIMEYWAFAEHYNQIDKGATLKRVEELIISLESHLDELAVMLAASLSLAPRLAHVGVNLEESWLNSMDWENDKWVASLLWQAWAGTGGADIAFHHLVWPKLRDVFLWLRERNGYLADQVLQSAAAQTYFYKSNGNLDRPAELRKLLVSLDRKAFSVIVQWLIRRANAMRKDTKKGDLVTFKDLIATEVAPFVREALPRRVGLVRSIETTIVFLRLLAVLKEDLVETLPIVLPYISALPSNRGHGNNYYSFRNLGYGLNVNDPDVEKTLQVLKKTLFVNEVHADDWAWDEVYEYSEGGSRDLPNSG